MAAKKTEKTSKQMTKAVTEHSPAVSGNRDAAKESQFVTKDTLLGEVVAKHPRAAFVMLQYGLHCIGCHVSVYETIEQGCMGHGMPPDVMEEMIADVNAFIDEEEKAKAEQATTGPNKL